MGEFPKPLSGDRPNTPVLDRLLRAPGAARLGPGGGLWPDPGAVFEMLGTGRVPIPPRAAVDAALRGNTFGGNETLVRMVRNGMFHGVSWHVFAGLSDSHTATEHLAALLDLADVNRIPVVVHAVAGMDAAPRSAQDRVELWERLLEGRGAIGTLSGAEFACDTEGAWDRTYEAFQAIVRDPVLGPRTPTAESAFEALRAAYGKGLTDARIRPVRLGDYGGVRGDFVCDFSAPRPAWEWLGEDIGFDMGHRGGGFGQLLAMFSGHDVPAAVAEHLLSDRGKRVRAFDEDRLFSLAESGARVHAAFSAPASEGSLVETAARAGLAVLRCGETGRASLLTRRFDGNTDRVWAGEERFFPSPVRDPQTGRRNADMCAYQLANAAAEGLRSGRFDLVVADLPELVLCGASPGEPGWNWAMEAIDQALGDLVRAAEESGGVLAVVAPPSRAGGGSEGWGLMLGARAGFPGAGAWIDVAPTLIPLLGLEPPPHMEGRPLIA